MENKYTFWDLVNGEYEIIEDTVNSWETDESIIMHNLILIPIIEREKDINEIENK